MSQSPNSGIAHCLGIPSMRQFTGGLRCTGEMVVVCRVELSRKIRHPLERRNEHCLCDILFMKAVPGMSHLILQSLCRPKDKIQFDVKPCSKVT